MLHYTQSQDMEFHFKAISIYHHLVFYSEIEDDIFEMACNRYLKVVPKVIHIGLTITISLQETGLQYLSKKLGFFPFYEVK